MDALARAGTVLRSELSKYLLESRDGEIERLAIQSAAMAPETIRMLELVGIEPGWTCLDIGCGPGGITDLLSDKVGASGSVTGLDMNAGFLEHARATAPPNVAFVAGDACGSDLLTGSFDLVHMRFVASPTGDVERLLAEAIRLTRPGGIVALQEPDGTSLNCYPPNLAWDKLKAALLGAFNGVGADPELAKRLYHAVRQTGLSEVQLRTFIVGVRAGDPLVDYLPSTVESLRSTIFKLGLLSPADLPGLLAECRNHLQQPDTSFTMFTVAQVWGRKAP